MHRMRRLRRYLPDGLYYLYAEWRGSRPATAAAGALTASRPGPLCRRRPQDRAGDGKRRRRLRPLRVVRRALSHRCLGHAEISHRYDLRRYIMPVQKPISSVNDFVVRFANVNGSGSASANELFARSILRHGVPVSPRNIFPSNIQGLPTWYEVRVTEDRHLGARGGRPSRGAWRRQSDGGDDPAAPGQGPAFHRARRLSILRLDQADAVVEI